jgi:8-oxo-dGTP diphosphatase
MMPKSRVVLVAACALINPDRRILVARRPEGKIMAGLWEFPGGKVEHGERPEETVIREFGEELAITINESCLSPFLFASHAYPDFHLLMPLFLCRRWEGMAIAREGQKTAWVRPRDLGGQDGLYPMPAADIPLIAPLRDLLERVAPWRGSA